MPTNQKRKQKIPPKTSRKKKASIIGRYLIKINEAPIRKKYISKFNKAKREIDQFQKDWEEFEKEDQPAFYQWYDQTFHRKILELQELDQKSFELENLLRKIESIKYLKKISFYKAYQFIKRNKVNLEKETREYYCGENYDKVDEKYERRREGEKGFFTEDEDHLKEIFEEMISENSILREMLRKNQDVYDSFYEKFKKKFFQSEYDFESDESEDKNKNSGEELLKVRYRVLVRKLHPDYRKKDDERLQELWHEVQKAYLEKDLEKLDMLHALCDIHTGNMDGTTSISQLILVTSEYKEQLMEIKERVKKAKKNAAWKFTKIENKETLKKDIDRQITNDIKNRKAFIDHYEEVLKSWSVPPKRRR